MKILAFTDFHGDEKIIAKILKNIITADQNQHQKNYENNISFIH